MGHKIITAHITPPIPERSCDWQAVFDNYDGAPDAHCPIGFGPTELSAIADLLEQEESLHYSRSNSQAAKETT